MKKMTFAAALFLLLPTVAFAQKIAKSLAFAQVAVGGSSPEILETILNLTNRGATTYTGTLNLYTMSNGSAQPWNPIVDGNANAVTDGEMVISIGPGNTTTLTLTGGASVAVGFATITPTGSSATDETSFVEGTLTYYFMNGNGTATTNSAAVVFGSGITNYIQAPDSFLAGFTFKATSPISITKLGAYDSNLNTNASNPSSETFADELVGVYDLTTSTLLGSATVSASDTFTDGDFRYAPLATPIALNTTDNYAIAAITNGNYYNCCAQPSQATLNSITIDYNSSNYVVTSPGNVNNGFSGWTISQGLPSASGLGLESFGGDFPDLGPNFEFTTGGTAAPSITNSIGISPSEALYLTTIPFDNFNNIALALANTNATTASVNLILYSASGQEMGTQTLTIQTNGHVAEYLSQIFPNATMTGGRLDIDSDTPILAVAVTDVDNQFSSLPLLPSVKTFNWTIAFNFPVLNNISSLTGTVSFQFDGTQGEYQSTILTRNGNPVANSSIRYVVGTFNAPTFSAYDFDSVDNEIQYWSFPSLSFSQPTAVGTVEIWSISGTTITYQGQGTITLTATN